MPKPAKNRNRQTQALSQEPELQAGQSIGCVTQACGENIYEVELEDREKHLYKLPKRLRYVTYVKRGSFVFIRNDDTRGTSKVRGDIEVVVLDYFLASLRKKQFWPTRFLSSNRTDLQTTVSTNDAASSHSTPNQNENFQNLNEPFNGNHEGNGEEKEEDEVDDWQIGAGNPNRNKWKDLNYEDDTSEEDED